MNENFLTKVETIGNYVYIGKAPRGSLSSQSVWQIKRVDSSSIDADIAWAEGRDSFEFVWDNKAIYTYK